MCMVLDKRKTFQQDLTISPYVYQAQEFQLRGKDIMNLTPNPKKKIGWRFLDRHAKLSTLSRFPPKRNSQRTGHKKFVRRGPALSGVKGAIEDTSNLMKITNKILEALKFEFTQEYAPSKGKHCSMSKKSEV